MYFLFQRLVLVCTSKRRILTKFFKKFENTLFFTSLSIALTERNKTVVNNLTIPFEITNINHGLQKASGLMSWNQNGLVLEFQTEDAVIGLFKSEVEEASISISDLLNVEFTKNIFSAKLIIEAKSLKALQDIPGTEQARCELKIKRRDRKKAARLASNIQLAISEHRLNEMDDME